MKPPRQNQTSPRTAPNSAAVPPEGPQQTHVIKSSTVSERPRSPLVARVRSTTCGSRWPASRRQTQPVRAGDQDRVAVSPASIANFVRLLMSDTPPVGPPTIDVPDAHGALTAREREVVALLVRGLTNRAIAQALCIAPPTAERHVANLLKKLGVHSRTEVAVWAITHQFVLTRPGLTATTTGDSQKSPPSFAAD